MSQVATLFVNGLGNSHSDALASRARLEQCTGAPVFLEYNSGHDDVPIGLLGVVGGIALSLINPMLLLAVGIGPIAIKARKVNRAYKLAGDICNYLNLHPFARLILVGHSQGTDIISKALKYLPGCYNRISVIALGGKSIASHLASRVINIQQMGDLVPNMIRLRDLPYLSDSKRVTHLIPGSEHSFDSYLESPAVLKCLHDLRTQ